MIVSDLRLIKKVSGIGYPIHSKWDMFDIFFYIFFTFVGGEVSNRSGFHFHTTYSKEKQNIGIWKYGWDILTQYEIIWKYLEWARFEKLRTPISHISTVIIIHNFRRYQKKWINIVHFRSRPISYLNVTMCQVWTKNIGRYPSSLNIFLATFLTSVGLFLRCRYRPK